MVEIGHAGSDAHETIGSMGTTWHDEVERKYDVESGTILPSLIDVEGVTEVGQPVETTLEAVYFDTPDLDLTRRGITLRRRTGGYDAGWHLKLPAGRDTRTEVRLPLGPETDSVPTQLLAPVRAVVRDRALTPVARVSTRRLEYGLLGVEATVLAQVCDDQVHAERLRGPARIEDWREWELELVEGDRQVLDDVEQQLLGAGASPGSVSSKLRRALGDMAPQPRAVSLSPEQLSGGSAAQLLVAHLSEHIEELKQQDARLRAERGTAIHKLRIAARRLRSALKTYRPLLASDVPDLVGEELRWLGQELSPARDAEVMRERLHLLLAAEPAELILGPVSVRIDDDLSVAHVAGIQEAQKALETERYFRLLDTLDDLVLDPPFDPRAHAPAREVLPGLLQRDARSLRRAVRTIDAADNPHDHDLALHEARKKAKRLRYGAESAVPVLADAAKLADSAKAVQEALGDHQDTVVARDKLREYGAQTHLSGENGFTFGRLHALEQSRADDAERRFEKAWDQFPRKTLRRLTR